MKALLTALVLVGFAGAASANDLPCNQNGEEGGCGEFYCTCPAGSALDNTPYDTTDWEDGVPRPEESSDPVSDVLLTAIEWLVHGLPAWR